MAVSQVVNEIGAPAFEPRRRTCRGAAFSAPLPRDMIPHSRILCLEEIAVPKELDLMVCRACGNEERASEGYPCDECGTFICLVCNMRGITKCKKCAEKAPPTKP